jgi:hypothetical protein
VGAHILILYIEDIYFLTRLSRHGSCVTLTGIKGGGLSMNEYIWQYCVPEDERHNDKVTIRDAQDLPLRTILFTI